MVVLRSNDSFDEVEKVFIDRLLVLSFDRLSKLFGGKGCFM